MNVIPRENAINETSVETEMEKLVFSSLIAPGKTSEMRSLLLAESIRDFAGSLAQSQIWIIIQGGEEQLSESVRERLTQLDVKLIPCRFPSEIIRFPLAVLPFAASISEAKSKDVTEYLAWLGSDTLVLRNPEDFILQNQKAIGVVPVHHTLVGSLYEEPLDPFWTRIYNFFKISQDHVFPIIAQVDGLKIRPYCNAGHMIVRPRLNILSTWRDSFMKIFQEPSFQEFFRKDERYAIFLHQAVLVGVILAALAPKKIQILPTKYNYPLHLYEQDVTNNRPGGLEELVTLRYESFFEDSGWEKRIPAKDPLKKWLKEKLTR